MTPTMPRISKSHLNFYAIAVPQKPTGGADEWIRLQHNAKDVEQST
jgi:hypothetical protein